MSCVKGSYALIMRSKGGSLKIGSLGDFEVPEGTLVYVGSAYGPGGLMARVSRHLRRGKRLRWHVDYLTESEIVKVEEVLALPNVSEEELFCVLMMFGDPIIPGFGCSDARGHLTHLFKLDDPTPLRDFLRRRYQLQEIFPRPDRPV
ncbi:MAG: GIY-YIG nuclease family protein [Candidatus Korarchaeota archaeon NZ13-K]|nr:MAG: GIY-YIG nuclease family protein [Candidatus Korarchaeota archaeon NZ13-K]